MPHSLLKAPPQQAFSFGPAFGGEIFPTGAPLDAEQFRAAAIGTSRAQAVARAAGGGARRDLRSEILERISSLADEDRLAVGGIVVRSWAGPDEQRGR